MERYNRDPTGITASASNDFLSGFCAVLQGFSTRNKLKKGLVGLEDDWVDSILVYQEYIKDRHHIHLSATRWKSVAGFVRFLGQKGIAEVKRKKMNLDSQDYEDKYIFGDDKANGSDGESEGEAESEEEVESFEKDPTKRPKWLIKLIDKSPEAILAAKSKAAEIKKSSEDETLQLRQMASVERRAATLNAFQCSVPVIVNNKPAIQQQQQQQKSTKVASIFEEFSSSEDEVCATIKIQKKNQILEEIAAEEMKFKREKGISETSAPISYFPSVPIEISVDEDDEIPWIRESLLVKIGNESIGNGKYLGLLAVIDEVIDDFGAQVTVLKNGDQLLLDQDDCIPISRVKDDEFDQQLSEIDPKIMSTALKTDRCILLGPVGCKGKEGRVLGPVGSKEFKVEISAAGSSQIHRKQFNLNEGQFCIYWE